MLLGSFAALLQFCTIIPAGKAQDFGDLARRSWLFPLAGYITGGIAAVLVFFIPSPPLAAAAALGTVILLSGLNHFDGLLDLGDALMIRGSREQRIRVLTDPHVGAGGVGLGLCITLVAFGALQSATVAGITILAGEIFAKLSLSVITAFGKPFHEGIHSLLHASSRPYFPLIAGILTLPLLLLLDPLSWIAGMAITAITAFSMIRWAGSLFGGVNGDVAGATHEIVRALVITGIVLVSLFP
ncbi:MAG: adenosylcobinamide-GDP ribazoletransferase [Methanomicrobiales archaeon]|nr:adenosylcobinamide-GDP ribazoletransferase [Methanomicrobiales archaeon]